jgi:gas vesicle protein
MAKESGAGKKIAIGAAVAAAAGFVAGILTAPKSGKETRQDIKKTANNVKREAEKKLKELSGELNDLLTKGQTLLKEQQGKAKAGLEVAMDQAKVAQQKVKEVISALKNGETDEPELKKAINEAKKARDNLVKYFKQ